MRKKSGGNFKKTIQFYSLINEFFSVSARRTTFPII